MFRSTIQSSPAKSLRWNNWSASIIIEFCGPKGTHQTNPVQLNTNINNWNHLYLINCDKIVPRSNSFGSWRNPPYLDGFKCFLQNSTGTVAGLLILSVFTPHYNIMHQTSTLHDLALCYMLFCQAGITSNISLRHKINFQIINGRTNTRENSRYLKGKKNT